MSAEQPITVGIDHFDQALAQALVDLRRCHGFVIATMDDEGDVSLAVCMPDLGDGALFRVTCVELARRLMIAAMTS
jgi:hypothetical protein